MMKNIIKTENDAWVHFFQRHLVPVVFTFNNGEKVHQGIVTAFVISVLDHWFLVTAGHCITEVENNISQGYKVTSAKLVDSLGTNAKHFEPIPFDYHDSNPMQFYDDYGFDYGVMRLRPYYRALLEANGVEALDERVWKLQPKSIDFYFLLGIPYELTRILESNIEFTPTFHPVEKVDERPEGFEEINLPLFYGRIVLGDLKDIGGMSGGPLFAFHQDQNGKMKYWLAALQSKWLPDSHYIAACPTKILGDSIEEALLQLVIGD